MSGGELSCKGLNAQGEPCGQVGNINPVNSRCLWHDPTRRKEAKAIRSRGAKTRNRSSHIIDDDLPPLVDHTAAEVWLDRIGRAIATGKIGASAGAAALRAATAFKDVRAAGEQADKIAELERTVKRLEKAS